MKQLKTKKMKSLTVSLTFGRKLLNVKNYRYSNDSLTVAFYTFNGLYIFNANEVLAIS